MYIPAGCVSCMGCWCVSSSLCCRQHMHACATVQRAAGNKLSRVSLGNLSFACPSLTPETCGSLPGQRLFEPLVSRRVKDFLIHAQCMGAVDDRSRNQTQSGDTWGQSTTASTGQPNLASRAQASAARRLRAEEGAVGGNLDPGAQLLSFGKYRGLSFEYAYDTDPSYIAWRSSQLSGHCDFNQAKFLAYIARRVTAEEADEAGLGAERPGESAASSATPSMSTEQRLHKLESMMTAVIDRMGRLEAFVDRIHEV